MPEASLSIDAERDATRAAVADPDRLAELRATALLDSAPEEVFDRITRLAERLLHVPVAMVSLVDRDRQFFKSHVGLEGEWATNRESALNSSFCQYVVARRDRLVITDAENDPLVHDNLAVSEQGAKAYAGSPLTTSRGHVLGSLCIIDNRPRTWTDEELALVDELSALAASEIDYRLRARSLVEIERLANALEEPIAGVRDAVASMAAVADRAEDPRVGRLASLARARLSILDAVAGDLAGTLSWGRSAGEHGIAPVRIGERVMRAVQVATASVPDRDITVEIIDRPLLVACDAYDFERSFVNLLVAAMQHASDAVHVHAAREDTSVRLSLRAEGRAMPVSELARLVSQLYLASCGRADGSAGDDAASLSSAGGATIAEKGPIEGRTGRSGTTLTMLLPLVDESAPSGRAD